MILLGPIRNCPRFVVVCAIRSLETGESRGMSGKMLERLASSHCDLNQGTCLSHDLLNLTNLIIKD